MQDGYIDPTIFKGEHALQWVAANPDLRLMQDFLYRFAMISSKEKWLTKRLIVALLRSQYSLGGQVYYLRAFVLVRESHKREQNVFVRLTVASPNKRPSSM